LILFFLSFIKCLVILDLVHHLHVDVRLVLHIADVLHQVILAKETAILAMDVLLLHDTDLVPMIDIDIDLPLEAVDITVVDYLNSSKTPRLMV
jgi:hypothetical protein